MDTNGHDFHGQNGRVLQVTLSFGSVYLSIERQVHAVHAVHRVHKKAHFATCMGCGRQSTPSFFCSVKQPLVCT